jgi:N utilization substance protein A
MELPNRIDAIIREISYQKDIQPEEVKESIELALVQTAKRLFDYNARYIASITENSDIEIFQVKEVVNDDSEQPFDYPEKYIYLDQAEEFIQNNSGNSYLNLDREIASILNLKYFIGESLNPEVEELELFEIDKYSKISTDDKKYIGDYVSYFGANKIVKSQSDRLQKVLKYFDDLKPEEIINSKVVEIKTILAKEKERKLNIDVEVGDKIHIPIDLTEFNANGIKMFFSQIERNIEDSIEEKLFNKYREKIGKIIKGRVISVDDHENTIIEFEDIRAVLTRNNRIKGEKFSSGDLVKVVIKNVTMETRRKSKQINLDISRTSIKFLNALLEKHIPEVESGIITVHKIARVPGEKSKVAVSSINPRIDPVTTIIGKKGVRINSISKEVNREIIDCFHHSEEPTILIKNSLSPARIESIRIKDKTAFVVISSDERGKAIGRRGINLKLANMLTGFEIKILNSETSNFGASAGIIDEENNGFDSEDNKNALEALFK